MGALRSRHSRWAAAGIAATVSVTALAMPSALAAPAPTPTAGTTPSGAAEAEATREADEHAERARERKLRNADVAADELFFGAEPLAAVEEVAAKVAEEAACPISPEGVTALALAPTWPETSGDGSSPSPMALARYDTQPQLGDPAGRDGLWFHPGIGVWQMDSAGFGANNTAGEAMDVGYIATIVVPSMVETYCADVNAGAGEAQARRSAWQPWVACWEGACEDTFQRALAGVTPDEAVDMRGGAQLRDCTFRDVDVECVFVDPANAQGNAWWAAPGGGASPLTAPFYSIRLEVDGTDYEIRHWLDEDSGAGADVTASRPFGADAREALEWTDESVLCDKTANKGTCVSRDL